MKQIILLFTLFAFAAVAFAQPTPTGDAKFDAELKRLTRRFENVESIKRKPVDGNTEIRIKRAIESAERALGRFKTKHPDYDVSKFESALVGFKNPKAKASNSSSSSSGSSNISDFAKVENFVEMIDEILDFNVDASKFIRNVDGSLAETKQKLTNFQSKMDKTLTTEVLALAADRSNRKIKRISEKANRAAKSLETELSRTDIKKINEETNQSMMLLKYFKVLFAQEKLKQLSKIFGDDANIRSANDSANKMINELGSIDDIKKLGEKNYAAKVAKNRMFGERQNNPALKKQFINAFNASIYRRGDVSANSTILKVHLVSSGWSVERNKVTGIIISRDQQAQIAFKATNGKCYAYLALMKQKHLGGGKYSRAFERSGSQSEILCSNVPK